MRRALVTGGGTGIGLAIARGLAAAGCQVVICGRDAGRLNQAAETLPGSIAHPMDVTSDASVEAALAAQGPIDILVNNAGAVESAPFEATSLKDWSLSLDLNLLGAVRLIRAAAPDMKARGWGRIINVASTAGLKGYAYVSPYVAAKHALVGLTRALALEFARTGVTVNAVCPGYTETDLLSSAAQTLAERSGRTPKEALARFAAANPQQRLVQPEEVAAAVVWLSSKAAASVNGAAVPISGGEV
jgi:NAD(P)-dependent dehydrogenase (short-subunit alcohol dehydrogenase family)